MTSPLFRQEVIEAGRERLTGTVVAATPPNSRVYAGVLMAVAVILVAILVFGHYSARTRVRGVVAYDAGIARVYPPAPAEIRRIHVRTGARVAAGAPIVTISLAQGRGGLGGQLAELANQDLALERQLQLAALAGSAGTAALQQQKAGLAAAVASLERQRSLAAAQIPLAEAATRRAAQLAAEGAGTQRQVEDSRGALLSRRSDLESIAERLIAQREALRAIDAQITERLIAANSSQSQLVAERAALAQERAALARLDQLVLTAPIAGEVGDIAGEVGQRARPETSLVTIVPAGSRLEVWLYAPSRALGSVRVGQPVRLQFDAFPHQKYGAGRGTVTAIASVPVEPAALDSALAIQEPVFRIRVAIDQAVPGLAEAQLRPGMTLNANLLLERRSLWATIFNPVAGALSR